MRILTPLLSLLLATTATAVHAQALATVSGRVVDMESGAPLAGAGVVALDEKGAAVGVAVADGAGRFSIRSLKPGEHRLSASLEGYAAGEGVVLIGSRNTLYSLGDLKLARPATLETLVVTAEAAPKADTGVNVFKMDGNVARTGGSVVDALRTLPGVTIGDEGQVKLRGSDRVPILVDGKPSALTGLSNQSALSSIPAGNIERIEIINNPSARYEAGGAAGIINLVMRKERAQGLHGDVGLSVGVGALSRRKPDIPSALGSFDFNPRYAPSINLTYNTPDIRAFAQAEVINRRDLPNNEFTTRFYDDGRIRYSQIPENRKQTRVILKGGVDWTVSDRDSFSVSSIFDWEHHNDYADIPYLTETGARTRLWYWVEDESNALFSASATYKHQLGAPGHQISLTAQYNRAREDELYELHEDSPVRIGDDTTHIIATENTFPVSLDYVRPLRSGRFEAGLKAQGRRIPVSYIVTPGFRSIIYPGLGDHSKWSEDIYAGYVNLVRETKGYAVEGGVRAEQAKVRYTLDPANIYYPQSDRYDYFRLYANARLTLNLADATHASVFFNNRVDRPGEQELRVYPKYDDPELLKVGNPYLRPQFTKTYEARLDHNWEGVSLSASLFRRVTKDSFSRVYSIDPTNTTYEIVNKIYHNTGRSKNTGLELLASGRASPNLKLSGSLSVYRSKIRAFDAEVLFPVRRVVPLPASKDTTWDAKVSAQMNLPWNVQFQASGIYYTARNIAQGRLSARSSIDLGLTKKLFDGQTELALTATDILNDFGRRETVRGVGFTAVYENFYQTQTVTAGLKHSF